MTKLLILLSFFTIISSAQAEVKKAYFAGGCFWCVESDFEHLDGVVKAISGFTGGDSKDPIYNGDHKGHYEAVEVHYDSKKVSYEKLLTYYWKHIDPFDFQGQFCDKGDEYKTAIFYATDEEKELALKSRKWVSSQFPKQTIATVIEKLKVFYPIKGSEEYHQDYYKKSPIRYKYYRFACGRDKRVKEIWGDK